MRLGFSLVELSIVLVILGMITGGIIVGQNLIHASELRSITNDYGKFQAAVVHFQDQYIAIPGDMEQATKFWGRQNSDASCVTNTSAPVNVATGVCDGDGNGNTGKLSPAPSQASDGFQFWRHLSMAGLIDGSYSGLSGSASNRNVTEANSPRTKLSLGIWSIANIAGTGNTTRYDVYYDNVIYLGATTSPAGVDAVLIPEDAWKIDLKLDDGMPGRGNMIARYWDNACANAIANDDYDSVYRVSDSSVRCGIYFVDNY